MAYVKDGVGDSETVNLKIFDITSGGIVSRYSIASKYKSAGGIVWSPDSQKIVFVGAVNTWRDVPNVQSSLFLIDLQRNSIQKLIDDQRDLVVPYSWNDADQILVYRTIPVPDFGRNYYYLDLQRKTFSPQVTLTPEP